MGKNISVITKLNAWLALLVGMVVAMAAIALYVQGPSGDRQALAITLGVLVAFTIAAGFALRLSVRESILRSIRDAANVVTRVAEGDLTARVTVRAQGETQKLLDGLERMARDLRSLVGGVTHAARTVATTSAQIAHGNLDLSQRTEEQASTLEETASSMEELTSTVAQNAENARQASQLAVEASDVARRGGQVVGQVVSTMNGISDSSRRIGDIIGVIDGIAFQTNILALNAAVEAARAGEQGRGFAVVASEVRNLAQRSAAAAKEIKELIGDSVTRVEAGTKQVDAAGRTMDEIVTSVKKVSDLIAEIAAASREQSSGIGQINTAVAQMEQVVQQNASLVEEASAATESMKEQAAMLLQAVSRFHLGDDVELDHVQASPITRAPRAPIKVKTSAAALPAYGKVLNGTRAHRAAAGGAGQWEEF
jgi:methyl-accepting chemotaxis protein